MADYWWLWMALAAVFIIGEIFTGGFFIFWFGIGALLAGVAAILGLGAPWQWGIFVVVSGVLVVVSRRFAQAVTEEQPSGVGADRTIGKQGVVLVEIDNIKDSGRVRIGKEEWRARSETGENLAENEKVEVVGIVGTHVVVARVEEDR